MDEGHNLDESVGIVMPVTSKNKWNMNKLLGLRVGVIKQLLE